MAKTATPDEHVGDMVTGELLSGDPDGHGVLSGSGWRYEGELKGGVPNGQGVMTAPGRFRYEGGFRDGPPHGQGVLVRSDGSRIEGGWKDGSRTGKGEAFWTCRMGAATRARCGTASRTGAGCW